MISKNELKQRIIDIITEVQGCKAAELITKSQFSRDIIEALTVHDLPTVLAELLHERRLIEIEYTIKSKPRSFLLPAGAKISINAGE